MRLHTSANALDLVVVRYEYTDLSEDRWDSNWLVVNGTASIGGETWRFTDPCVTTFELADLADWLDDVARNASAAPAFELTEPLISFAYILEPAPALVVRLGYEAAPPWLDAGARLQGEHAALTCPLGEVNVSDLASQVRAVLMDFPIRGGAA